MSDIDLEDNSRKSVGAPEILAGTAAAAAGLGVAGHIYSKKHDVTPQAGATVEEAAGKIRDLLKTIRKPADKVIMVVQKGGTPRVVMGAVAAVGALGAGYAVHKYRNRNTEAQADSFTNRLDQAPVDQAAGKGVGG